MMKSLKHVKSSDLMISQNLNEFETKQKPTFGKYLQAPVSLGSELQLRRRQPLYLETCPAYNLDQM